jgi:hypothetical protein
MLYYTHLSDSPLSLEYIRSYMDQLGLKELKVVKAQKKKSDFFFCAKTNSKMKKGYCGKIRKCYSPYSKAGGKCQYYVDFIEPGEETIIKL